MARERFFYHEKGNHSETWHYLCDGPDGSLHVESEYAAAPGDGPGEITDPISRTIEAFLASGEGTPQSNLRVLLSKRGIAHA